MSEPVLMIQKADGITTLTLNRPKAMNALSLELRLAIVKAFEMPSIRPSSTLNCLFRLSAIFDLCFLINLNLTLTGFIWELIVLYIGLFLDVKWY